MAGLVPGITRSVLRHAHPHPEEPLQAASRRRLQCSLNVPSRRILAAAPQDEGRGSRDVNGRHSPVMTMGRAGALCRPGVSCSTEAATKTPLMPLRRPPLIPGLIALIGALSLASLVIGPAPLSI